MAKATPLRSGDLLAGVAAENEEERTIAQMVLAEVPLTTFLDEPLIPDEKDEVSRLILESLDEHAFSKIKSFSVGSLRDWLLDDKTTGTDIAVVSKGLTPEMVAAVSKLMRLQELIPCCFENRSGNPVSEHNRSARGVFGATSAQSPY